MYVIGLGCLCIYRRKTVQAQIFLKPFIGEMFTYKKHPIHRNSSTMVINMVTDIKQTCLWQGLGVTFTARKRPSKLMFTMKDLGHTLPGRQNWTFASNSRCYYFKKSHANHCVKQLSKLAKLVCLYKLIYKRAFFQVVVWVVRHKINDLFNIKAVMLDIPEPSMLNWECWLAQARLCRTL